MSGGTLFGEEEGSGDWRRPVGIVSFGNPLHTRALIRYTPKGKKKSGFPEEDSARDCEER